ncbi:hypothetical protein TELCIR_18502 [Teladorsagia circumcincta]|uniref:Uncharacterized protein n=1 Tax=Teladorsagia circumcincta TaxID=45464 RepID=A0A2G9TQ54_TELCI|nr:hypothetical protein TELCIR_18502 [Teladorsagia circumcincta]
MLHDQLLFQGPEEYAQNYRGYPDDTELDNTFIAICIALTGGTARYICRNITASCDGSFGYERIYYRDFTSFWARCDHMTPDDLIYEEDYD